MKKTYITVMPNHIGAFLEASRCFAALDINITRVSYNKAVDSHTLFIDVEGEQDKLLLADAQLEKIGYLPKTSPGSNVILLEFTLPDKPGSVTRVLELIARFRLNISYMSMQQTDEEYQQFKMGLFVDDQQKITAFLSSAKELCPVRVVDYDPGDKVFDNSIFYTSFVSGLPGADSFSESTRNDLLVNINLAMQTLDDRGLSPYRTFDSIHRFAELLAQCRGENFRPRITSHSLTENTSLTMIEPECGSNTFILQSGGEVLFIESGYACYRREMVKIFRQLLPQFDTMKKRILITHADLDHCGLLPIFDEVIASQRSLDSIRSEWESRNGFREENALHKPYIQICKALTQYETVNPEKVTVPWKQLSKLEKPLESIGYFSFGDLVFEVYEGMGGHLPGEIVLLDYTHRIAFTGDVYVNIHGMTPEQRQYNRYAPILMTSVDTDPEVCRREREDIFSRLNSGSWKVFGSHGAMYSHTPV